MPVYKYEAIDQHGVQKSYLITASTLDEAKRLLRQQNILLSHIELKQSTTLKISQDLVATFFHQLSMLLQAGFPLYEALIALQEQYEGHVLHELLLDIADQIQAGLSLAQAISAYPLIFDQALIAMVRAGERGASLNHVLERCAQVLASQQRIKKQLITSMIYPALLALSSLALLLLMLLFVVPSLEPLFVDNPPSSVLTLAVFGLSRFLRNSGLITFWVSLTALGLFYISLKRYRESGKLYEIALRLPMVGRLLIHARLARFGFVMQALLESGVVLVDALDIAQPIFGQGKMGQELQAAKEKVLHGQPLSLALSFTSVPLLLIRLIRLGENSGNLASAMKNLKEIMDEDLQKDLTRLTAAAQPVILIIMGTLVGLIMAAILIPLTDIGQLKGL